MSLADSLPREADHVPESDALALLLAAVVEALALAVGGVLEDAAVEGQAQVGGLARGEHAVLVAQHHLAARVRRVSDHLNRKRTSVLQ